MENYEKAKQIKDRVGAWICTVLNFVCSSQLKRPVADGGIATDSDPVFEPILPAL